LKAGFHRECDKDNVEMRIKTLAGVAAQITHDSNYFKSTPRTID